MVGLLVFWQRIPLYEPVALGGDLREKNESFFTYGWHWWVIFINLKGNFNDGRPEAIAALLVGKDKDICIL